MNNFIAIITTIARGPVDMLTDIFRGPGSKRVLAIATLSMCFVAGALASLLAVAIIDPFVSADLANGHVATIGGGICAVLACAKFS